jgi:hypothetical protein
MNAPSQPESTALAVATSASAGALLLHEASMERLERIADLMSSGKTTVPQHLRGSKGDCFAIVLQSMQWGMNPFSVAQKTHLVNGTLGYEAQLVAAVINSSGAVQDRFHFEWFGDWAKIVGRFKEVESKTKKDDNGYPKKYIVPAWEQKDEQGLGVRVWATLKGEKEPRVLELLMTQARTRNSTLWTEDPKQQLAYLAQKRWSRLYAPDVILGVYTPDEMAEPTERFMGPAEEVTGAAADTAAAATTGNALPEWTDAEILKREPKIAEFYGKGKTADDIIAFYSTKATLSDAQKKRITELGAKPAPAAAAAPAEQQAQDVTPKVTYAAVADRIAKAKDHEQLDLAKDLIGEVADAGQRAELVTLANARGDELAF